MRDDDFILIRSVAGAIAIVLLSVVVLHLAHVSLWLWANGVPYFTDTIINWLLALIPLGSLLGCATGARRKANLRTRSYIAGWFCGCVIGAIFLWYLFHYLDPSTTLPLCVLGLLLCGFLVFLTLARANRKPPRIPRQW